MEITYIGLLNYDLWSQNITLILSSNLLAMKRVSQFAIRLILNTMGAYFHKPNNIIGAKAPLHLARLIN